MTANTYGRQIVLPLTNKSGGSVAAGDVVIYDSTTNDSFTTTTSAASLLAAGIAQETIASNAVGRVLTAGYAALVNVNASVTRLDFGGTHTVAKQAASLGSSRLSGAFMRFLSTSATPDAYVYPVDLAGAALTNPMSTVGAIIQGTTAGAPAALVAPLAGKVLTGAGVTTPLVYSYPPGYEIDYVQITSGVALTNTTEGTAHTVITGTSVTYENVPYVIHFYTPDLLHQGDGLTIVLLYDGATVLGRLGISVGANGDRHPMKGEYRLTPTAAAHQYIVKAYVSSGQATIGAGTPGSAAYMPAFIRATKV